MTREDGFYWIRIGEEWTVGEWTSIPRWTSGGCWTLLGTEEERDDADEVGAKIERG